MAKYIISIKEPGTNTTKIHHVAGFNMQLIEKKTSEGIVWKNHMQGTNTQEVAMMITNLLEQYPEITIEMLTRK